MNGTQELIVRQGPTEPGWLDIIMFSGMFFLLIAFGVFMIVAARDIWRGR